MAKTEVAKAGGTTLPAHIAGMEMTGAGVSTSQEDLLTPMVRILQALSPEVEKKGINYVQGAEPGMILIKNISNGLFDGDKGFLFQPVEETKAVVEWVPRSAGGGAGGGFVGTYPEMPASAIKQKDPNNPKKLMVINKETGNLLVDTRYRFGFIFTDAGAVLPAVIPFSSTGHSVARGLNTLMALKSFNGKIIDAYCVLYRVKTKLRQRGTQNWYVLDFSEAGEDGQPKWATTEQIDQAKAFRNSILKGERKVEQVVPEDHDDDDKM